MASNCARTRPPPKQRASSTIPPRKTCHRHDWSDVSVLDVGGYGCGGCDGGDSDGCSCSVVVAVVVVKVVVLVDYDCGGASGDENILIKQISARLILKVKNILPCAL